MKKISTLFWTFLKIGAFTFGGGYAMVALLEHEFVEEKQWVSREEFLDMVAIAESTPGPVAVNSATYIGYKIDGTAGAAASTVAVCIPSFVVIYCISLFFDRFLSLTVVAHAFRGIQVCVIYLILSAGLKMLRQLERNAFNVCILAAVIAAMVGCSVAAFFLSNAAIAKIGVNKTSSFIGVSTIVSILAGALALGEPLHIGQIVGVAVIVAGVYTANRA